MADDRQVIITLGREFGSGGHALAERLAVTFGLTLYDKNLLALTIRGNSIDDRELEPYDEKTKSLFSRTIRNYGKSVSDSLARAQFDLLTEKAMSGESFIAVGRCATNVLRKNKIPTISLFVTGDKEERAKRVTTLYDVTEEEARRQIARVDKERASYQDSYFPHTWGNVDNYDLIINSSLLGLDVTGEILEIYIRKRLKHENG